MNWIFRVFGTIEITLRYVSFRELSFSAYTKLLENVLEQVSDVRTVEGARGEVGLKSVTLEDDIDVRLVDTGILVAFRTDQEPGRL